MSGPYLEHLNQHLQFSRSVYWVASSENRWSALFMMATFTPINCTQPPRTLEIGPLKVTGASESPAGLCSSDSKAQAEEEQVSALVKASTWLRNTDHVEVLLTPSSGKPLPSKSPLPSEALPHAAPQSCFWEAEARGCVFLSLPQTPHSHPMSHSLHTFRKHVPGGLTHTVCPLGGGKWKSTWS